MADKKDNSGYSNSGNSNSGNSNSGNSNSGNYNSGYYNSGNYNSGHYNSGDYNSGHYNSGDYNSGDSNSGNANSGNYNSGNRNSGFFCTEIPKPTFFDTPVNMSWEDALKLIPGIDLPVCCQWISFDNMTAQEKKDNPNAKTLTGYLKVEDMPIKKAFPIAWAKLIKEDKQKWLNLPNFDADKFLRCTGVDVRKDVVQSATTQDNLPNEIVIDGVKYKREK
jgi:hypothetical protein